MISMVNHVSFTVSDLNKSVEFYSDILGLECISILERDEEFSTNVTGIPGVKMKIAYMKIENCSIELIEYISGSGIKLDTKTCNIGSAHICLNIREYDAWLERMRKYNVQFSGKVCVVPAGPNIGKRVCYIKDNDGNNIEFIESI